MGRVLKESDAAHDIRFQTAEISGIKIDYSVAFFYADEAAEPPLE